MYIYIIECLFRQRKIECLRKGQHNVKCVLQVAPWRRPLSLEEEARGTDTDACTALASSVGSRYAQDTLATPYTNQDPGSACWGAPANTGCGSSTPSPAIHAIRDPERDTSRGRPGAGRRGATPACAAAATPGIIPSGSSRGSGLAALPGIMPSGSVGHGVRTKQTWAKMGLSQNGYGSSFVYV